MIASVQGLVQHVDEGSIVLETGGVGIRIEVPSSVLETVPAIGKSLLLHTQLIVREDSLNLFGFRNREQRELFNTLIKISGVGPQLGLAILSHISPEILHNAVANNQPEALTIVPGIGRKTAEKIVFFLKDRFELPLVGEHTPTEVDNEVMEVLTGLGYSMAEIQAAMKSIPQDASEEVEERVRLALQHFATR
jgi:Holliday junction DNA helicase RuvA